MNVLSAQKNMLSINNMGETIHKHKNAHMVHKFLEMIPIENLKEGEEGISWHEIFVLYKMCGGNDMICKPMSGAQKRASLEKQFNAFKKCARHIINHAISEDGKQVLKPGNMKKPRLLPVGILTRVATINGNVNLTNEAKLEVEINIIKMQKNYSNNNVKKL